MTSPEQATRLAVSFAREVARSPLSGLCVVCAEALSVSSAGITIMGGDHAGPICVSDPNVKALEDLQFTIGQGPCRDAFHNGEPVHVPRLDVAASERWPPFVDLAIMCGIAAVFAYPLTSEGAKIGILTLYEVVEGDLTVQQDSDAIALAAIVTEALLSLQESAPAGTLAPSIEDSVAYRAEIYQASGMLAIQLGVPSAEALVRMRAHAFANDRPLDEVASDIVGRRLRLGDDRTPPTARPDQ
jgi:hypothetical protein